MAYDERKGAPDEEIAIAAMNAVVEQLTELGTQARIEHSFIPEDQFLALLAGQSEAAENKSQ